MPVSRKYDYFDDGSAARKLKPQYDEPVRPKVTTSKKTKVASKRVQQAKKRNNASLVAFILSAFTMSMIVIYRFNIINEKNLRVQELKSELEQTETTLVSAQIQVEQSTDLNQIEAYAKQQLGMQKPEKNQTIYVDTSEASKVVSEASNDTTILEKVTNFIRNVINQIF